MASVRSVLPHVLLPTRRDASHAPLRRPLHAHRLDRGTSGLLLVAKTRRALRGLSDSFAAREIRKRYRAIVVGRGAFGGGGGVGGSGRIDSPIGGAPSLSEWRIAAVAPLRENEEGKRAAALHDNDDDDPLLSITTLDLWPCTGRQHQLRRHCAALGHPIVGDRRYGQRDSYTDKDAPQEMLLSSVEVAFTHPVTSEPLTFEVPEPPEFEYFRALRDTPRCKPRI